MSAPQATHRPFSGMGEFLCPHAGHTIELSAALAIAVPKASTTGGGRVHFPSGPRGNQAGATLSPRNANGLGVYSAAAAPDAGFPQVTKGSAPSLPVKTGPFDGGPGLLSTTEPDPELTALPAPPKRERTTAVVLMVL